MSTASGQDLPALTQPVNDFAGVVDEASRQAIDGLVRQLQRTTGDVVVVATVDSVAPFGDIRSFAVELFENGGRGIGERGRDNGLLVVLAVADRQVWVEVGYDLEPFVTDGFAGETSRLFMVPQFQQGAYGPGLLAGVTRLVGRIAQGRNVTLDGVPAPPAAVRRPAQGPGRSALVLLAVAFLLVHALAGRARGGRRGRGRRWHSGVGPFGGGFGGGGGGFGGGFGGFGGGRSGGGGGGAGW
ncbi:MAG: YgcG family protein [Vicinamibacterales bacterium]